MNDASKTKSGFLDRFRRKKSDKALAKGESPTASASKAIEEPPRSEQKAARKNLFSRALERTGSGLGTLFLGKKAISDELFEQLETLLLMADVGIETTGRIIDNLVERTKRRELEDSDALFKALRELLVEILEPCAKPMAIDDANRPHVVLVVGVNGVGKTTTIGKLARHLMGQRKSVVLVAGDTFRAAAVEQLQAWGERNRVPVVAQHSGADSASVIFDGMQSAAAKNIDVLIADTAGRLHTKSNLMEELRKVKRVMAKLDERAPHEVLLVVDAGTGQNALNQMQQFHDALGITGVVLTKLDGTAKGGVIFALCQKFAVPIRFVGLGEGQNDLQPFDAGEFVDALLEVNRAA